MFEGMAQVPTGETDRNGQMIFLGDRVRRDDGLEGAVVFAFCAFRVDLGGGGFLRYNSTLLFSENGKKRFEIIKEKAK